MWEKRSNSHPDDDHGHGTHVAGIVGGCSNNAIGITGVARESQLLPLKVLNSSGNGLNSDVADAIRYAVAREARVINLSLGGPDSEILASAVEHARAHDALVVAAMGNYAQSGNPVFYPAAYDLALGVGATNSDDGRAEYSEYHQYIDVAAPRTSIYSTWINGYTWSSGTSMATPYVSGLAALIWSVNPTLSAAEVHSIITSTADALGEAGHDEFYGYGRINMQRALDTLITIRLQHSQGQSIAEGTSLEFAIDLTGELQPASIPLWITTTNPTISRWAAVLSTDDSWLKVSSTSGRLTVDQAGFLVLTASRPTGAFGRYTTSLRIDGRTATGETVDSVSVSVDLLYLFDIQSTYLPLIMK